VYGGNRGIGVDVNFKTRRLIGFWTDFLVFHPLGDFVLTIFDELFHLVDFDRIVTLFVFAKEKQVGFVLRAVAMKKPFVLRFDF
jgi:hypothetical protein